METVYRTIDGLEFNSSVEAKAHEDSISDRIEYMSRVGAFTTSQYPEGGRAATRVVNVLMDFYDFEHSPPTTPKQSEAGADSGDVPASIPDEPEDLTYKQSATL